MAEKREIVRSYVAEGLTVQIATSIASMSKSTYYYESKGTRKGRLPSTSTPYRGQLVPNENVVKAIDEILSEEFIDYGYKRTCMALRRQGYRINPKKVYRLMREANLLFSRQKASPSRKRTFVKYTVPAYERPFATLEMDIKYVYIWEERRNAFLLTILDTFSRLAVAWELDFQMKAMQVAAVIERLKDHPQIRPYLQRHDVNICIRTDNGPQFVAKLLADSIEKSPFLEQEFIRPATPQQNGHIESFHDTLQRLVINTMVLQDLNHARNVLDRFFDTYNNKRIMESILYLSPMEFLQQWETNRIGVDPSNHKKPFFFRERQTQNGPALSREDSYWSSQRYTLCHNV